MKKKKLNELKDTLKEELKYLGISFLVVFVILKAFYYKESVWNILLLVIGLYYLFVMPGYMLLLTFKDKIPATARLVLGLGIGLGAETIIAYYLNMIFGIPVFPYYNIYPVILAAAGIGLFIRKKE